MDGKNVYFNSQCIVTFSFFVPILTENTTEYLHPNSSLWSLAPQLTTPLQSNDSSMQYLGRGLHSSEPESIQYSPPSHSKWGHGDSEMSTSKFV